MSYHIADRVTDEEVDYLYSLELDIHPRPMETCPKNGWYVLLLSPAYGWTKGCGIMIDGIFRGWYIIEDDLVDRPADEDPIGWLPLPKVP